MIKILSFKDGVGFYLYVRPKSAKNKIEGEYMDGVKLHITKAPKNGEANKELIHFLSKALNLPISSISIYKGERGKKKIIKIKDISLEALKELLDSAIRVKRK
ncbi:MAG: DUF167 domain-containing protein [Deltaproteobacteria bacterium]|nr:DUF167 domain-containing protein [Deltaproteobacteria bacterium]